VARSRRGILAALAGLGLAACGVERIAQDRTALRAAGRIGVVTPAVADAPSAPTDLWLSVPFGHIGRFVDAALKAERDRLLAWALVSAGYDAAARWSEHLTAALLAAGSQPLPVPVGRFGLDLLAAYPAAEVDAYLDTVVPEYGFSAGTPEGPFIPFGVVMMRVALPDGRVVLQDQLVMNAFRPFGGERIGGPGEPRFATAELFPYDFMRAAEGVDAALAALARQVVARLR
jgi:hypothetical protein